MVVRIGIGCKASFLQPIAGLLARKATQRTARGRAITDRRELCRTSLGLRRLGRLGLQLCITPNARRNAELQASLQPIAGAVDAVRAVHALLGGRIACASGADRQKVEMQLAQVGLASYFGSRVFSGHEMPRTKPAPDVYLAAAAALKVDPARCLVVEDTVTGVTAGVAAGATVVGYSPSSVGHSSPEALRAAGAVQVIADMALLPALLA